MHDVDALTPEPPLRLFQAARGVALVGDEFAGRPDLVGEEHLVGDAELRRRHADRVFGGAVERRGVDHAGAAIPIGLHHLPQMVARPAGQEVEGQEGAEADEREFAAARQRADTRCAGRSCPSRPAGPARRPALRRSPPARRPVPPSGPAGSCPARLSLLPVAHIRSLAMRSAAGRAAARWRDAIERERRGVVPAGRRFVVDPSKGAVRETI